MNKPTKKDEILGNIIFLIIGPISAGCWCSCLTYTVFPSSPIWRIVLLFVPLLLNLYLLGSRIMRKK